MNNKLLVILIVVILLLVLGKYFLMPDWYRESDIKLSGWLIMISVAFAIALSLWLIHWVIERLTSTASRGGRIGSYIGGYGIFPFAVFLGFVVGGNFGGAIGEHALGDAGTVLGIGLGILIVTIIVCSTGALLGLALGGLSQKLVK